MNVDRIAHVAYEAVRTYALTIGDQSQKPWHEAGLDRQTALRSVEFALRNPASGDSDQPPPPEDAKPHQCRIPWSGVPVEQRTKEHLFRAVVRAFTEMENQEKL